MKSIYFILTILLFAVFSYISYAQPGELDLSFNPGTGPEGGISKLAIQKDGKIIIVGPFQNYQGVNRNRIARLNSNGTLDASFDPGSGANNIINTLAIQNDGKIIIGGNAFFTSYNGTLTNRIARLNADGSLDTSFKIGSGPNNIINTISLQNDGKIIIGGNFTLYDNKPANYIARLNTDGTLDASFNPGGKGANFNVLETAIQSDGKIIVGGAFSTYNDIERLKIVRLNADGSVDQTFIPVKLGLIDGIRAIAIQSNKKIIVGGIIGITINGTFTSHIVRLNENGSIDATFNPSGAGADNYVYSIALQNDGKIILGGTFGKFNNINRSKIARLNADGSLDLTFTNNGSGADGDILTSAIQSDGKILIAGSFSRYRGTNIKMIARINSTITSGFELIHKSGISIYPNPFTEITTLLSDQILTNVSCEIYNTNGIMVRKMNFTGQSLTLNRDNLPSGLYFIKLEKESVTIARDKLIIVKE